MSYKLKTQDK
ncbi:Protein of unknown function [Bacillus wiedmannii]|nr:Protein of unknown function [Bacillus wiedmannii]